MKIIIVGTAYPYRGGLAAFNGRLAQEFVKEGHEVEIYTFTVQYPSFLFPGKTQYSTDKAPENLKITRKINSVNPANWIRVGNEIREKNPDLVIFCYWISFMAPCFGTIAGRIRKNKNITCIGLIHNMIPHETNILDKLLPGYFVKSMQGFITLSQSVILDIDKFDRKNKPKSFSPHPIYDHYGKKLSRQEALKELALDDSFRYVLFFGFIRAYKGLDLLLEAFGENKIKERNIKLLVAGEFYENEEFYKDKIRQLGIGDKVMLYSDFIPDDRVNLFFSAADIIAQPYKTATQSGVTQIAYHFEKPMLVTNVGGLPEIVPHQKVGYVVEPDPSEIASALADFYDMERDKEFVSNILVEKEKYSWSTMVNAILSLKERIGTGK